MKIYFLLILPVVVFFKCANAYEVEGCEGDCDPCLLINSGCIPAGYIEANGTLHLSNARQMTLGNKKYLCKSYPGSESCKAVEEWVEIILKQEKECRAYSARMEKECEKYKQTKEYQKENESYMNARYSMSDEKIDMSNTEYDNPTPSLGKVQDRLNKLGSDVFNLIGF